MGRFSNARAVPPATRPTEALPTRIAFAPLAPRDSGIGQRAGFALLCVFIVSPYANECATRLFHVKAYISTVSWVLLPLLLLLSGNLLRAFRDRIGWLWLMFLAWILLATPFSVWRGGSLALLVDYIPHGWIQLFYFAAFAISVRHLDRLMLFLVASDFLLLIDCFWGGSTQNGRLEIPDSMFFRNANDLSLQLIIALTQFVYLLYQRQPWKRALGAVGIAGALLFMLETGARGAFLALLVLAAVSLAMTRHRVRSLLWAAPAAAVMLAIAPAGIFHRVTLIASPRESATEVLDQEANGSQTQRLALLQQSVDTAFAHPLLGVGPGQFAVAASGELTREGKPAPWLGTHNSYTQVASECGIPAFLLYTFVIFLSLGANLRVYRRTLARRTTVRRSFHSANALAFCLFQSTLAYAVCTFFFHVAYGSYLPAIAGMSVALRLAVGQSDRSDQAA